MVIGLNIYPVRFFIQMHEDNLFYAKIVNDENKVVWVMEPGEQTIRIAKQKIRKLWNGFASTMGVDGSQFDIPYTKDSFK